MAQTQPFVWVGGGQQLTYEQTKKRREVADALAAKGETPQTFGAGLNRIGEALLAKSYGDQASASETAGAESRKSVIEALLANSDPTMADIGGALGNDWVANDAGSSAVVQALLGQELQQNDPLRQQQLQMGQIELDNARNPQPAAPIEVGGVLVDPVTYEPVYDSRQPDAPEPFTLGPGQQRFDAEGNSIAAVAPKPSEPLVQVNTGDNSGQFGKKADELAAVRLGDIVTGGQGAAQFMGDIQTLAALGAQVDTGKGAEIMNTLGPYAQALGIDIAGLPEGQAYQALIDRLAPQMRPVGAGATSDFDARQFLSSLPGLGKTPEGNAIIMQTLSAVQEHKMAAAEIAGLAFAPKEAGGITWQEAEKRIRELPNPYEGFNDYSKQVEGAAAPVPAGGQSSPADIDDILKGYGL
jgi:hypothetical protein